MSTARIISTTPSAPMTLPELQEFATKHLALMPADELPAFVRILTRLAYDAGHQAARDESTLTCHLNGTTCRGCGGCEN
jgi:hypothetical protein